MKKIIILALSVLIIASLTAGCSCGGTDNKKSSATTTSSSSDTVSETTKVIETTPDGGTVEEDSEGNKITKDKNGEIISVTDKDGNEV
ncbi:MAG: hypothetical protein IJ725_04260, partial [Ruminococcus sp.]|nr:hypothetical protein [Ruminococcus sp.]